MWQLLLGAENGALGFHTACSDSRRTLLATRLAPWRQEQPFVIDRNSYDSSLLLEKNAAMMCYGGMNAPTMHKS